MLKHRHSDTAMGADQDPLALPRIQGTGALRALDRPKRLLLDPGGCRRRDDPAGDRAPQKAHTAPSA